MSRFSRLVLVFVLASVIPVVAQETTSASSDYRVGAGDMIRIDAFGNDEISGEFLVETSGTIAFPLLGSVKVEGRTASEISRHLEQMLEKDYYVDVQLQVEVAGFQSQPVTLLGEVQRPGTYYLRGRTTITQLLADAGGLSPNCGSTLELRREEVVDGEVVPRVITFSTTKLRTGETGRDVEVRAGDVISVSAKELFFITGEVARPGQYEISQGLTVMQALSQAGGPSKFASQTVELHRETGGAKEITKVDLAQIRKGKATDPHVEAGDVLIVRRRFF